MSIPLLQKIVCRFYLVIILVLFSQQVWASNKYVPSIINIPDHVKKDTSSNTRQVVHLLYGYDSISRNNWDSGIVILKQALAKSEKRNFSWGICYTEFLIGLEYYNRGYAKEASEYLLKSAKLAERPENIDVTNMLYNILGNNCSSTGKYALALNYYYKALAAIHKKNIKNGVKPEIPRTADSVTVYTNVGILWARLGDLNYALQTFLLAKKIREKNNDTLQGGTLFINIATCYKDLGNLQLAEDYYNRALTEAIISNARQASTQVNRLAGLSDIAHKKKEYEKALRYLDSAEKVQGNALLPAYVLANRKISKGRIYLNMNNYSMAKPLLLEGYTAAKEMQQFELLGEVESLLAKLYATTGEHKKAYDMLMNYTNMKDTLLKQEQANSVKVLTDVLMAEKDRNMLEQTLEITRQKNKLQQKNFWIGGIILCSLLLLAISFVFVRNYRHKQAIQQSLLYQLQQTQEINQLKAQVRGEEQERQRIARELHDNIAAQLWGIKLNVDNIQELNMQNGKYDKMLASVFQQLTDAAQDVRKTAHNLMPDLLLEEGLATAIASICEKTGKNTKLEVDFQEYGVLPRLDKELELSIYRMVQELIQNVLKHATDATLMLVQLSYAGTMLNITVEDNGTVFNTEKETDGTGLQQIKKRVSSLKGYFDLQSIPGKGTTAYLEFDLQHLI